MDSSMTHKIIKARQYADEPQRIHIHRLDLSLDGDDRVHHVELEHGVWRCDCEFFAGHRLCAHTMAVEKVMGGMLQTA
jgi:hypothetical protein